MSLKDRVESIKIKSPLDYLSDEQVFLTLCDLKNTTDHRGFVLVRERAAGDNYLSNCFTYHTPAAFNRVIKPYFNSNSVYCGKRFRAFSLTNNTHAAGGLPTDLVEYFYSPTGRKIGSDIFRPALKTASYVSRIIKATVHEIADKMLPDYIGRIELLKICSEIVNCVPTYDDLFIKVIFVKANDKAISITPHLTKEAAVNYAVSADNEAVDSHVYKLHHAVDSVGGFFFSFEPTDPVVSPPIAITESTTTISKSANATASTTISRGIQKTFTKEEATLVPIAKFRTFCYHIGEHIVDYYLLNVFNYPFYSRIESAPAGGLHYVYEYNNTDKNRLCKLIHDKSFNANYIEFWAAGDDGVSSVCGYMYCGDLTVLRTKNIIIDYIFNKELPPDCIRLK
jgi:hypothetical protein